MSRLLTPFAHDGADPRVSHEFQVTLPLLAKDTFHGDAGAYGFMIAAFGAGAVFGGLLVDSGSVPPLPARVLLAVRS